MSVGAPAPVRRVSWSRRWHISPISPPPVANHSSSSSSVAIAIWLRSSCPEVFFLEKKSALEWAESAGLCPSFAVARRCCPALKISVRVPDHERKARSLCEMNDLPRAGSPTIASISLDESGVRAWRQESLLSTVSGTAAPSEEGLFS